MIRRFILALLLLCAAMPAWASQSRSRFWAYRGPPTPPTQSVTFGAKTPAGYGCYTPTGGSAYFYAITAGDPTNKWAIRNGNCLVPSGTYGNANGGLAASYSLTLAIYKDLAHTQPTGASITANVTVNSNQFTVAPDSTDSSTTFQLQTILQQKNSLVVNYGDTVKMRCGIYNDSQFAWTVTKPTQFADGNSVGAPTSYSSSGWVTVSSESGAVQSGCATVRYLNINAKTVANSYLAFDNVTFQGFNITGSSSTFILNFTSAVTGTNPDGTNNYIKISNSMIASRVENGGGGTCTGSHGTFTGNPGIPRDTQIQSGLTAKAAGSAYYWFVNDRFDNVFTALNLAAIQHPDVLSNTFYRCWNDCLVGSTSTDFRFNFNFFLQKVKAWAGSGCQNTHGDHIQISPSSFPDGSIQAGEIVGNEMLHGSTNSASGQMGQTDGQGVFIRTAAVNFHYVNLAVRGNFMNIAKVNCVYIDNTDSAIITNNTCTQSAGIDGGLRIVSRQNEAGGNLGGVWSDNASENFSLTASGPSTPPAAATNNVTVRLSSPPVGAYLYTDAFVNPVANLDDPTVTRVGFGVKSGGPLDGTIKSGAYGTGYVDFVAQTATFPDGKSYNAVPR